MFFNRDFYIYIYILFFLLFFLKLIILLGHICFPETIFQETTFQTFLCLFIIMKGGQRKILSVQRKTLSDQRKILSSQRKI